MHDFHGRQKEPLESQQKCQASWSVGLEETHVIG